MSLPENSLTNGRKSSPRRAKSEKTGKQVTEYFTHWRMVEGLHFKISLNINAFQLWHVCCFNQYKRNAND
jgi:hypothetical protein